jgi:hypothetical protein
MGKPLHSAADDGNRRWIVHWSERHCFLKVAQDLRCDPLMPVQLRTGMHNAVSDCLDRSHLRFADCV